MIAVPHGIDECDDAGTRWLREERLALPSCVVLYPQHAGSGAEVQDCNFGPHGLTIDVMTSEMATDVAPHATLTAQLRHVRWLAGGTASGKTTAAAALARHFDLEVYAGDRAEHDWLRRCSPQRHPRLAALRNGRPGDNWRNRSPEQAFAAMAGRHGETISFLVEDLLARPADRVVLVDYFGVLPRDLAPLLSWPEQAAFLVPTPSFRRAALNRRYADPKRARANWGELDPATVLEARLARDALWDAEVTDQTAALRLPLLTIDGKRSPGELVRDLAEHFRLDARRSS